VPTRHRSIDHWSYGHALVLLSALGVSALYAEPRILTAVGVPTVGSLLVLGGMRLSRGHVVSWANGLTTVRLLGVGAFGVVATSARVGEHGILFAGAGLILLLLDAVDGYLARRLEHSSFLGAEFDKAVDAYLVLMLSACAYTTEQVGLWILLAGSLRYLYILAEPVLKRAGTRTPRSLRARICFVAALVGLLAAYLPVPAIATPLAAVGTGLLTGSFLIDGAHLAGLAEHWRRLTRRLRGLLRR
jgi:phosphatidylglycerophosphate synthase